MIVQVNNCHIDLNLGFHELISHMLCLHWLINERVCILNRPITPISSSSEHSWTHYFSLQLSERAQMNHKQGEKKLRKHTLRVVNELDTVSIFCPNDAAYSSGAGRIPVDSEADPLCFQVSVSMVNRLKLHKYYLLYKTSSK